MISKMSPLLSLYQNQVLLPRSTAEAQQVPASVKLCESAIAIAM